ncbi:Subunit of heteropentameric Replication factor C (RF-C) [Allomyces arbusculus]|nr:Subunit of heteropentameric Replication factor C (RF-C) [Allomyces arbusculus]
MALWADKHRPTSLASLDYHVDLGQHLERLANEGDFPHSLVYGPDGAGKKTRIMATLRALYGPGVEKIKIEQRTITASTRKIEVNLIVSNYHIEINPVEAGIHDRLIVQELIKELAQTQNIDAAAAKRFKVVIISEADSLTLPAQHALRRTMEKYMANLRVIMCCNSTSKIIPAIQSRCLLVRVAAPSHDEISTILRGIARKEGFTVAPEVAAKIATESKRNLRRAILMLEALYVTNGSPSAITAHADLSGIEYDWEVYIADTATMIIQEQSGDRLGQVRTRLYELLAHCIPPNVIMRTLAKAIADRVQEPMRPDILIMAAHYEHSMCIGSKPIFHLEAFVAKAMAAYKRFCVEMVM